MVAQGQSFPTTFLRSDSTFQDPILNNFRTTGGPHRFLRQNAVGAAIDVVQPATTDLSDVVSAGSWTPSDQSGAGLAFSNVSVSYTQIGNMVFAYGRVTYPATVNGNSAKIGGLPITVANVIYAESISPMAATSIGLALVASPNHNTTTFSIFNAATLAAITNAQLTGATVLFNISYPAS